MKNHERYRGETGFSKVETFLSNVLWRIPSDRNIMPVLCDLKGIRVCEIGCGDGWYTRKLLSNGNDVLAIDQNADMFDVNFKIFKANAVDFLRVIGKRRCDVVFSAWLSEYLDKCQLDGFLGQSYAVLRENGKFISTFICKRGWGNIYVSLAKRLRGIHKYSYSSEYLASRLNTAGFKDIEIENLPSWFGIPWAMLVTCRK